RSRFGRSWFRGWGLRTWQRGFGRKFLQRDGSRRRWRRRSHSRVGGLVATSLSGGAGLDRFGADAWLVGFLSRWLSGLPALLREQHRPEARSLVEVALPHDR